MDSQEARIYLAVAITVILLGIIIVYFTLSVIRQQRKNLELQKENAIAEINAMEKERARIANDLHDEIGPVLSVVKFQVDAIEDIDPEEKELLKQASESLDSLIGRMREVANNLMPSALHRKGLIPAIKEFVSKANSGGKTKVTFLEAGTIFTEGSKSINIYRIIQEIVNNCLKHADAKVLEINMTQKNGMITILCKDDGRGFDLDRIEESSTGIGLKSLRNRSQMMGGNMQVETKIGKGSAFLFEIPQT